MEKKKQKSQAIELQLECVKETSFFIDTSSISITDFDIKKMIIEFGFKVEPNIEQDLFILNLLVKFQYPADTKKNRIVELTTENHFKIKKLGALIEFKAKTKFQDKAGIMPTLLGIALGTLRGILIVKTTGTILADYPLPLVNPTDLCNKIIKEKVSKPAKSTAQKVQTN